MEFPLGGLAGRPERGIARRVLPGDERGLAGLMLAAYRDTADDEEQGPPQDALEEVQHTLSGKYGDFLWEHSFLIDEGGEVLSASLVTIFEGAPLLAFSVTHPSRKRRGLAGALILTSARSLRDVGNQRLVLFVSEANLPARKLYEKLGFRVVEWR